MTVTATRSAAPLIATPGNLGLISDDATESVAPTHASEIFWRVPGAWVTRNSGQESLVGIRSPVLSGAGACGAFLFLEDGLPARPAGFCNVNQLFELNVEQARGVEVVRGPGSALYGSNALHGTVNVLMPTAAHGRDYALLDVGPADYLRGRFSAGRWSGTRGFRVTGQASHDGGWRDDTGHEQGKANVAWLDRNGASEREAKLAATALRQETAGYITGFEAYRDSRRRRSNPNPEAFRDADSLRASFAWRRDDGERRLELRPYVRASRMEFLQHFLPGQPLEENGQLSAGLQSTARTAAAGGTLHYGLDLEAAEGYLEQFQAGETTGLPPSLAATRPPGFHYDYEVRARAAAPWVHWERPLAASWSLGLGLRAERLHYRYDNRMLAGSTRDDGSECLGGCLYTRPDDRSDRFDNLAPKLSLGWRPAARQLVWLAARRGFRAPQATELYRLQSGQSVADLASERLDSLELGWRGFAGLLGWELAAYRMDKRNYIFRDGDGFNVADGRTRHVGLEVSLQWQLSSTLQLATDQAFARHTWRFDRDVGRGEIITSGNDTDSAPRRFGSTRLAWEGPRRWRAELEWISMGSHWLNAANTARYDGHDLLHLRVQQPLTDRLHLAWRVHNLADTAYAERADFAFGEYRYFPGRERSVFLEIGWRGL
ncbi:MAG TPA: TonB-dependent receptor [Gammaproteobacteria bacterium]|nr:TonB-dependent receptor [Gammaproteobacteria bacterium]